MSEWYSAVSVIHEALEPKALGQFLGVNFLDFEAIFRTLLESGTNKPRINS